MKASKFIGALLILGISSCGQQTNKGTNADRYSSNDTAIAKKAVDTFQTDSNSYTNGPDNAPPKQADTSSNMRQNDAGSKR